MRYPTRRIIGTAAGVGLLVAALTGCGGGDGTGEEQAGGEPAASGASMTFEEYQLAVAECMREQGVDMPDPEQNGDGVQLAIEGDAEEFAAAMESCRGELGEPPAPPGGAPDDGRTSEERDAENLEAAACLREHGVDVADPAPGESLTLPMDVPEKAAEECTPDGVWGGVAGPTR